MLKPIIRMLAFATCIFYPGLANGGILTAEEAKEVATDFSRMQTFHVLQMSVRWNWYM